MQARLTDSNKNLVARALSIFGELAKAMGPAWERVGRPVLTHTVTFIADNKSQVSPPPSCLAYFYLVVQKFTLPHFARVCGAPHTDIDRHLHCQQGPQVPHPLPLPTLTRL